MCLYILILNKRAKHILIINGILETGKMFNLRIIQGDYAKGRGNRVCVHFIVMYCGPLRNWFKVNKEQLVNNNFTTPAFLPSPGNIRSLLQSLFLF